MNDKQLDRHLCFRFDVNLAELHSLPAKELNQLRADLLFELVNR